MPSVQVDPKMLPFLVGLPAGEPPEGVQANFESPHKLAPLMYSMGTVFVFIMLCFVSARFYFKTVHIRKYTLDDCESFRCFAWA